MARICSWCGLPDPDWLASTESLGTALKPAFEPIVVARKPLAGTVAANVLERGTGALNIDACRVGDEVREFYARMDSREKSQSIGAFTGTAPPKTVTGRWPTNG